MVKLKLRESLKTLNSDDFIEQMKLYWKAAIKWYLENKMEAKFINIYQQDPKVNNGRSLQVVTEMSSLVMNFFKKAKENGILKDFSVGYICLLAHNSTHLAAQYLVENPKIDKEEFINITCDFFLEGVLKKQPHKSIGD